MVQRLTIYNFLTMIYRGILPRYIMGIPTFYILVPEYSRRTQIVGNHTIYNVGILTVEDAWFELDLGLRVVQTYYQVGIPTF